jgi:hypothetical protein
VQPSQEGSETNYGRSPVLQLNLSELFNESRRVVLRTNHDWDETFRRWTYGGAVIHCSSRLQKRTDRLKDHLQVLIAQESSRDLPREHFIARSRCGEAVKLFRLLLLPYSLVGSCSSVQNCTFRDSTGTFTDYCTCREAVKLFRIENPCSNPLMQNLMFQYLMTIRMKAKLCLVWNDSEVDP